MDEIKSNEYGSHLPLLSILFDIKEIRNCIEFGLGLHSTSFFLSKGIELTSIETDLDWIKHIYQSDHDNHKVLHIPEDQMHLVLDKELKGVGFDLAFIDGPRSTRWKCVNSLANKVNTIVVHDTNKPSYNWENISLPREYGKYDYEFTHPWTTVFTTDKNILDYLCQTRLKLRI